MQDGNRKDLPVFKFFCFSGEPKLLQVIQNDKQINESIDYFDIHWNLLDVRQNYPNSNQPLSKPMNFDEMLNLVRKLSKDRESFIRVDLYQINEKIYFSEYTFFSDGGMRPFDPPEWDKKLGAWIELPKKKS